MVSALKHAVLIPRQRCLLRGWLSAAGSQSLPSRLRRRFCREGLCVSVPHPKNVSFARLLNSRRLPAGYGTTKPNRGPTTKTASRHSTNSTSWGGATMSGLTLRDLTNKQAERPTETFRILNSPLSRFSDVWRCLD